MVKMIVIKCENSDHDGSSPDAIVRLISRHTETGVMSAKYVCQDCLGLVLESGMVLSVTPVHQENLLEGGCCGS